MPHAGTRAEVTSQNLNVGGFGAAGMAGAAGADGGAGAPGIDGIAGADGAAGIDGIAGAPGIAGGAGAVGNPTCLYPGGIWNADGGGSPATVFLQWHIDWPKLPVIRVSTGICNFVLTHDSATIGCGKAGGFGAPGNPGGAGAPGIAGFAGICGAAGGVGAASGGRVYCVPRASTP
jgi:hypothetical protein